MGAAGLFFEDALFEVGLFGAGEEFGVAAVLGEPGADVVALLHEGDGVGGDSGLGLIGHGVGFDLVLVFGRCEDVWVGDEGLGVIKFFRVVEALYFGAEGDDQLLKLCTTPDRGHRIAFDGCHFAVELSAGRVELLELGFYSADDGGFGSGWVWGLDFLEAGFWGSGTGGVSLG